MEIYTIDHLCELIVRATRKSHDLLIGRHLGGIVGEGTLLHRGGPGVEG